MSSLAKTRGILLRHSAYSETSRVLHWFTEDFGRISTVAKGAMRPRNPLLGQCDQLYTCEVVFYHHERETAYITREVTPLAVRPRLRTDWRAALGGLYLADLAARATPPHVAAPDVFRLLHDALDVLGDHGWRAPVPLLFEIRLLTLLGLAPQLDQCAACDRELDAGSSARFEARQGGLVCPRCASAGSPDVMAPDVLAILRHWQRAEGWTLARTARCQSQQLSAMADALGLFIAYHLDILPNGRATTLATVFAPPPRVAA
ncbi:MAG TPA: DNA repair protein RecO [Kiritimatiellia bacterium]|nr:DNA repair protein RecO [Kiritimatiellia bacterium]HMP34349.1 DNA repair protein RecO [Kiritimatiellia bacterium]